MLDGGATEDGRPYLVMEYVEGLPLLRYCEEHRLSGPERLRLFIQVARAVQAAHAQLVVHRDIKPSSVLVTAMGDVKLLDFGIAKLLDPDAWPESAPRTRTGFHPLTPEYASPEQVRGEPITTASDIYQLGLLLHRLLTGGRPFEVEGSSRRALEEAITDARRSRHDRARRPIEPMHDSTTLTRPGGPSCPCACWEARSRKMGRQDEAATIRRTAFDVQGDLGLAAAPHEECDAFLR